MCWSLPILRPRDTVSTVALDRDQNRFEPLQGNALSLKVEKGGHYGASIQHVFLRSSDGEPEEIYFRYYLRLGNDWDPEGPASHQRAVH